MMRVRVTTMLVTQWEKYLAQWTAQLRHGSRACEINCQSCQSLWDAIVLMPGNMDMWLCSGLPHLPH
eukprot:1608046-Amphidinium_carterae.1